MSDRPEITDAPIAPPPANASAGTIPVDKPAKQKAQDSWVETIKTIVYALLIAFVIRTFLFQPFNIP
jgi:signal peptidase I